MRRRDFAILLAAFVERTLGAAPKPADLNLTAIAGGKARLKDYRGKIVVLNFWATWCGPCKEETPMLVAAHRQWAGKGIVFIGASLDDRKSQNQIPAFIQTFGVAYPIWTGATGDDLARLAMGEAVPATAFIDEDGLIFSRVQGEIKKPELTERLAWATGDRRGPAPLALVRNL